MAIDFPLRSKSKLVIALPYNEFSEEILLGGNSRKTQKIIIDKKLLKKLQFPISQWAGHDVFLSNCTRWQSFSSLDLMLKRWYAIFPAPGSAARKFRRELYAASPNPVTTKQSYARVVEIMCREKSWSKNSIINSKNWNIYPSDLFKGVNFISSSLGWKVKYFHIGRVDKGMLERDQKSWVWDFFDMSSMRWASRKSIIGFQV